MAPQSLTIIQALDGVRRLFLDTPPVIYHIEGVAAYQAFTDYVFQRIQGSSIEAVTSSVTLAECLVHPYAKNDQALVDHFREVITAGTNTRFVGVDPVVDPAAQLRARYRVTLADAFQVAAAISEGCDALLTNDLGLRRVNELRVIVLDELVANGTNDT